MGVVNAWRFGRQAAGTSLVTTGVTWTVWQVADTTHSCPPVMVWVLITVAGCILVRGKKKSQASAD